jgi:hypothetical protein
MQAFRFQLLKSSCTRKGVSANAAMQHKPIKVDESLHRGNADTHSSHTLFSFRGLIYCNRCGARAGASQVRLLAKPCDAPGQHRNQVLKCINCNNLPNGVLKWPDDESSSSGQV